MASYPGAVPTEPSINPADMSAVTTHATDRGLLWDEVIAICQELGTTPSGSWSTVAARLQAVGSVCQVRTTTPQSITDSTSTVLSFGTEDLDPLGWHAPGTPTLVTPTIAGWYRVSVSGDWQTDNDYTRILYVVLKNGAAPTPAVRWDANPRASTNAHSFAGPLIQLNGSTDAVSISVFQQNTSAGANTIAAALLVELVYPT